MSYMTISSQEKHNFSLCSCFHAHPTTLLLKILGGTNAWILGGTVPPVPPRSPPLSRRKELSLTIVAIIDYLFSSFGKPGYAPPVGNSWVRHCFTTIRFIYNWIVCSL